MSEEVNTFALRESMKRKIELYQSPFIAAVKRQSSDPYPPTTFVGDTPFSHVSLGLYVAPFDNEDEAVAFKMKTPEDVTIIDQRHDVHESRLQIWREVSKEKRDARGRE